MKTVTQGFKDALKNIKQIDAIISYADKENTNFIITQNSEFLITQAQDFLATESAEVIIDNGGIQNVSIYWNTDILKSCCKMLDLETSSAIPKGTELNVKVGLLVGEDYEYVDYGKFYAINEPKYNLDTNTYTTTAYDRMINFNIKAIENPLTFETGVIYTLEQYLKMICNKCGVSYVFDWSNVINYNKAVINGDPYAKNKNITYRDILDDIAECLGTNFIINADNKITNKELLLSSGFTIDADILKDNNVYIGEKKDPIDGIQIYDGSEMIDYYGDDTSIFKIKSNNIMSANSENLRAGVLPLIHDFYYYDYQLETFGVLFIEPFDCFTATYKNTNYLLTSMHNDIMLSSGLSEEISYTFKEEDNVNEYMTSNNEDNERDAFIQIDKANSQVVLKANANGNIVQAELTADPETGSEFNINADNINLEGYTTINGNFKIDNNGNMECKNATFKDGDIILVDEENTQILKISKYFDSDDGVWKSMIHLHGFDGNDTDIYPGWIQVVSGDGEYYTDIIDGTIECDNLEVRGSKNRLVRINETEGVLLNAYETATPYFGDIGSNKTNEDGYCKIPIDKLFAKTIEIDDYKVFIQKCGEGHLYVKKHKNYFEVFGTANLDFDWELKAIQKGYKNTRLEKREMKPLKGDDN